ncbi:MAG: fibronectin type III domain-containing protein, partial [Petrotogales bacterium]
MHKSNRKTGMNYVLLLMIAAIIVVGIVLTILLWPKPEPEIIISSNSPRPNNASQISYSENVELYWEVEYDRPNDDLYADVWAGKSEDSLEKVKAELLGESSTEAESIFKFNYALPVEPHETYYWKVKVYNVAEKSDESDTWSFTLKNSPPEKPVLINPKDNETDIAMVGFNLEWEEAVDPDGDSVTYDVFLGKNRNLDSSNIIAENIQQTDIVVTIEMLDRVLDPDTNYYWKVRAKDHENLTTESNTKSFITEVIPGLDISLISPEDNATNVQLPVNFKWELSSGEYYWPVIYEVFVGEEDDTLDRLGSVRIEYPEEDKKTIEFTDETLKGHTNYVWYVKATNVDSGVTNESEKNLFTTINKSPELSINEAVEEDYNIVVSWEATDTDGDEVFYDIYMKKADEAETVLATDITETSYTLPEPESSTEYTFRIEARDDFGGSVTKETSLVTGNTPPEVTLLTPENERQNTDTRNLRFEWEAYDRENDNIEFTFILVPPEGTEISQQITEQFYEVKSLESLTTYQWYVEAKDDKGAESKSNTWSFTTGNTPPDEPVAVSPEEEATDFTPYRSPVFRWFASDPDNDELSFEIELAEDSEFNNIVTTTTDYDFEDPTYVATFTDVVLDTNTEYYWRVTASDDESETAASWKFRTFDIQPETPVLINPEAGTEGLETVDTEFIWEAFDEDDPTLNTWLYLLKEDDEEPEAYDLGLRNAGGTEEVATIDVPLEPETEYQWWIVVEDLSGKKAESEKRSFVTGNAAPIITFPSEKLLTMKRYGASTPLEFDWEINDPEGEDVSVEVYFSDQRPPSDVEPVESGINLSKYTYKGELEPNKWYYFWIVAEDVTGAKAEM